MFSADLLGLNPTTLPVLAITARLAVAALLGAIIGFERELRNRPAGLRTHMLTSLAAAAFTVLTFEIYHEMVDLNAAIARLDPLRVIEAVTAGGAFLRSGGNIKGLTTGAGMWMAGAIGVACGSGFYVVAAIATVFVVVVTFVLGYFERRVLHTNGEPPEGTPDA